MAHFRGTVRGDKSNSGDASRLGHKALTVHANGWDGGACVRLYIDANGRDCARIELDNGSGYRGPLVLIYDGPIDEKAREAMSKNATNRAA